VPLALRLGRLELKLDSREGRCFVLATFHQEKPSIVPMVKLVLEDAMAGQQP
jgi:hypothetical protein